MAKSITRTFQIPINGTSHQGDGHREMSITLRSAPTGKPAYPENIDPANLIAEFEAASEVHKRYRVLLRKLEATRAHIAEQELTEAALGADLTVEGNAEGLECVVVDLAASRSMEATLLVASQKAYAEMQAAAKTFVADRVDAAFTAATAERNKTAGELAKHLERNEAIARWSDAQARLQAISQRGRNATEQVLSGLGDKPAALPESQPAEA